MDKIIYTGDQDTLLEKCGGQMWTLIENESHIKSASSDAITEKLIRDHLPDKRHFAVHYVAMGAGEDYGFNRNGDWFGRDPLRENHDTFVKHGHYFVEHANRDPKKKIGDIKASAFNEPMKRVELMVHGDKEKAEKQYARAKAGKDMDGSMSCRVSHDVCSICDNKAKSSKVYCSHAKNHMTQYLPQFRKFAYVKNPKPKFFDFSDVANRADRIARHLEVNFHPDDMQKAASAEFRFSEDLATEAGILLPISDAAGCENPESQQYLIKLAACEDYINAVRNTPDNVAKDDRWEFVKYASLYAFAKQPASETEMEQLRKLDPAVLFRLMAKRAAVIPFPVFCAYLNKQTIKEASEDATVLYAQEKLLPTVFNDLLKCPANSQLESLFEPASTIKEASVGYLDSECRTAVNNVADRCSMQRTKIMNRAMHNSLEPDAQPLTKQAAALTAEQTQKAKNLASAYGFYKVAACRAIANLSSQDLIDSPTLLLIACQHRI